jgi:hypothetical protein
MTEITNAKAVTTRPACARWAFVFGSLALAVSCGDVSAPATPFTGIGGFGGSSETGGMSGTGGMTGIGGMVGNGGSGGGVGPCVASTPPDDFLCDTDDDCDFSGWVCIDSGCKAEGGARIKQCAPSWAPSCSSVNDCPNGTDYECTTVAPGGERCVRVTGGCSPATETYDCAPGFSCEGGTCVDRRIPCDTYQNCPKSHICLTVSGGLGPIAKYCARVSRTCRDVAVPENDCSWLGNSFGSFCDDVDDDGTAECTGERDATGEACVNADCGGSVCETGPVGSAATCGDYGLCRTNDDCDTGFECVGLWQDDRRECVPTGGTCDQVTDCDPQQVCAAPRNGGSPRCQTGKVP